MAEPPHHHLADHTRLVEKASAFELAGNVIGLDLLEGGHINRSWRLRLDSGRDVVLQRINEEVFHRPEFVAENLVHICQHLKHSMLAEGCKDLHRRILTPVPTLSGAFGLRTETGFWRVIRYIPDCVSWDIPHSTRQACAAARLYGAFQRHMSSYAGPELHITIPDFHNTPRRILALERAVAEDPVGRRSSCVDEVDTLLAHREVADWLLAPYRNGRVPKRIVHNDAKMSNILFDRDAEDALCVIDLDTVMPGLSVFDFGDIVRSMACTAAEDSATGDLPRIDIDLFESVARGYLAETRDTLNETEWELLVPAAIVITYEQALRFLTDHLRGDVYYTVSDPLQNLSRCRTQIALFRELLVASNDLRGVVNRVRP